ncbi:MAG: large conductance mechanosensitive channel protein MscL [Candidatus Nomurabacteria bacterium]|nr:large conductance mechanosensitive channel protein MscL [Candidatus Nomurabacteria bacterium]
MFKEFKQFLLRGNVVDLAVGVVVGAAFGTVVTALVKDILTPVLSGLAHVPDFGNLFFSINGSKIMYGDFLNSLISFILVAASVFFFIIKPMNLLIARSRKEKPADESTKKCTECLSTIPLDAKRCSFCTQVQ